MPELVLASASPRRHALLSRLVADFRVRTSAVEEVGSYRQPPFGLENLSLPEAFKIAAHDDPRLWAWRKAGEVVTENPSLTRDSTLVLGADTVVVSSQSVLNKPTGKADATRMLKLLRNSMHLVVTGYCLLKAGQEKPIALRATVSHVTMKPFTDEELAAYIETGESMDKAGAYALQGVGRALISRVEGCTANVVGLPICEVRDELQAQKAALLPYPVGGYCSRCPGRTPR